jgi:alkyl hydroperoxide reductase subunit AhpC
MLELGQLESHQQEFAKRNARVVVVSIEDQEKAKETQTAFPHLVVVADAQRGLANALEVIHRQSNPHGGDSAAPTTLLVDGKGVVRWMFRPDRAFRRLSPAEVLAALDEHMPQT